MARTSPRSSGDWALPVQQAQVQPDDIAASWRVHLVTLKRDRFVSVSSRDAEGCLTTEPFTLPRGELFVNARVHCGQVVVGVCDPDGRAIPGFEASQAIAADVVSQTDTPSQAPCPDGQLPVWLVGAGWVPQVSARGPWPWRSFIPYRVHHTWNRSC